MGSSHQATRARTLGWSPPRHPSRPATGRKKDGRPQPELRKRRKGREVDYRPREAWGRKGRCPGHHTHPRALPPPLKAGSAPAPRPLACSLFVRRVEDESRRQGPAGHPSLFHAHNCPLTCRPPRKSRTPLPPEVRPQVQMPPLLPEKRRRGIQGVGEGGGTAGSRGGR